ncbi:MAG: rRNA pseudouridine synthase [Candidatus Marinimicrobia bacterium]|jgi:23S rRNA pseudouridine2605 synthase|nr:rRNA pseudouridine synthase [Candidatus Neomarinimicrobiota bacterium]MBT3675341.1 rRNA pseudouridine synthase [Candidatus Neomarinimicrobiota bacterium]MBT3763157.1 rRNA pseudouridine synthase [Candidatus Neomarinimicrobiota bacterium]MBT4068923.1 rRNA pseudouridine synthase [Candidatus Neomarinimicrobiota bacterium]MBT4270816.1 rRNA pseudouridine synthase [Candidatus Neomarinimicrobiota bacterium]
MRLNKFIAQAGIASRREADKLIKGATVTINGVVEVNPAYDVQVSDDVRYDNARIKPESNIRIILLNKPEGYITTVKDPMRRKTVMDLIQTEERLFPVGRLDKDSTGLLLLTNDGALANKLMHPKNRIPRIYKVVIDKVFRGWEVKRLATRVYIGQKEWGRAEVVEQQQVKGRATVLLRLYQGKKREVRRMMYRMKRKLFSLDRIQFGPIELGNIARGAWRDLNESELKALDKLNS